MQPSSLYPGTLLRERYRILERVGGGGYGIVYKAYDEGYFNRVVAIKQMIMSKTLSAQEKIEITDYYNREVTLLSALRHKSLPEMYDHFTDPECWYTVMQYIEGKTLEEHLEERNNVGLPVGEMLHIGTRICTVLDYLHRQKPPIIFRDVKPDNIMQTSEGNIYLIDFGTARRYREGQHDTGALGTPGYAAPEQYGNAQTEPRTDIYGLGATLQTLLTGRTPLEIKMSGLPPAVFIPRGMQSLLEWMMEEKIEHRPKSVASVHWYLKLVINNPDALDDPDGFITNKRLAMKGIVPQKLAPQPLKTRISAGPAHSLAPLQPQTPVYQPPVIGQPAHSLTSMQPQVPVYQASTTRQQVQSMAPLQSRKPAQPFPPLRPPTRRPPVQPARSQSQAPSQTQKQSASFKRARSKRSVPTFFHWGKVEGVVWWVRIACYVATALFAVGFIAQEYPHMPNIFFWIGLIFALYMIIVVFIPIFSYVLSVLLIMCWGILRFLIWLLDRIIYVLIGI